MPEEFAVLLFFFGIAMTTAVGFAVAWYRGVRRIKKLEEARVSAAAAAPAVEDGRLDRMEQIVEGLASQVDQLQASQEFLSRLLTNKPRLWNPEAEPKREVTPH